MATRSLTVRIVGGPSHVKDLGRVQIKYVERPEAKAVSVRTKERPSNSKHNPFAGGPFESLFKS